MGLFRKTEEKEDVKWTEKYTASGSVEHSCRCSHLFVDCLAMHVGMSVSLSAFINCSPDFLSVSHSYIHTDLCRHIIYISLSIISTIDCIFVTDMKYNQHAKSIHQTVT